MSYVKHLMECRCFLSNSQNKENPIFYRFKVFSLLDQNQNIVPKLVKCNNCNLIHRIKDVGQTTILSIHEDTKSVLSIEDIKLSIPNSIADVLESYKVDLTIWEEVQYILENEAWNKQVILTYDDVENKREGKLLKIKNHFSIKVENFTDNLYITEQIND